MFSRLLLEHPWWLLLLAPLLIGIFTRTSKTYFSKAHSHIAPVSLNGHPRIYRAWQVISYALPKWIKVFVLILMIAALADVTRGYTVVVGQKIFQRFIIGVDATSSMYGFFAPYSSITCKQNGIFFPRIKGSCRALRRVVDDVEKETKGEIRPRVLLGLIQWAYSSAVVSYPTSDYVRFREKIENLEFMSHGLGVSTLMHNALWNMFLMAFDRNMKKDSGYTHLTGLDIQIIYASLAPGPPGSPLYLPKDILEKVAKIKLEMRDTIFIMPTDAVVYYLKDRMDGQHPSIRRVLQLAEIFEIPVQFLSTDEDYPELKLLARRTGFGPPGGPQRGDFRVVRKEGDVYLIDEMLSGILESRFGLTVPTFETHRESYADLMLEISLTLLTFGVLWKKILARSLTDAE